MNGLIRFAESLFPHLWDTTWKATALMMLVFALNRVLGKRRVAARYWLCVYCLVGVLVLPLTSFLAKGHGLALLPAKARPVVLQPPPNSPEPLPRAVDSPVATKAEEIATSSEVSLTPLLERQKAEAPTASEEQPDPATEASPAPSPTLAPAPLVEQTVKPRSSFPWKGWAGLAWLTGFTVSLLRLLLASIAICRIRASSSPVSDSALTDLFEKAKRAAGVTARVRLSVAKTVASPVSLGMFRPSVLLPETLPRDLPSEQLYPILLHELAHIRSGDCAVNILERIVRSLLFFHPLVWLMSREMHSLREEVCDERVLDSYSDGVQCARVLAEVAGRNVRPRSRFLTTSCFFNHRALIERRVERILSLAKHPSRKFHRATAMTLLAVSFAIVASLSLSFLTLSAENAEEKQRTGSQAGSGLRLPERIVLEATYNHRSRGGDYGTSKLRIEADRDGAITAIAELRGTTYVASGDKEHRLKEYKLTSTERGTFEWILTFEPGKVTSKRKSPDKDDEVSEIPVAKDSLYDPNSRPDPYCVANILLRQFALKEGDAKEINASLLSG